MPKPAPAAGLPRFVELVRVSGAGQAARDTPEDQRRALEQLRRSRPGAFVERIDEAISASIDSAHRSDLARLLELGRARAFDELRVRHLDRCTRHDDPRERFVVYGIVRDAGAVIVSADGQVIDPATDAGELSYYVQTLAAAQERRRIVERTREAKERLVREGRLVNGRPPWGRTFDARTGRWGIDKATAATYRRLFEVALAGSSLRAITARLNAEGVEPPGGGKWTTARVSHLLAHPAAMGVYTSMGVTFEIPPIVDRQTFEAVRARMRAASSLSGPRPKIEAMLRKLLTCAVCGSSMYVDKGGSKRYPGHYYTCSGSDPACRGYHRIERVDAAVRDEVAAFLRRPRPLRLAAESGGREDDAAAARREVRAAMRELRDLDGQEERVARLVRRELIRPKTGDGQLAEVARLRSDAEARLAAARARVEAAERREEMAAELTARLDELRRRLGKNATPEAWREVCLLLFPRVPGLGVRIYPDGNLELRGSVPLNDAGEAALARAARKPFGSSREGATFAGAVPVLLTAAAPATRGRRRS